MSDWVLRKDGVEIARHSTRIACGVEAIERGLAHQWKSFLSLNVGVTILREPAGDA